MFNYGLVGLLILMMKVHDDESVKVLPFSPFSAADIDDLNLTGTSNKYINIVGFVMLLLRHFYITYSVIAV